MTKKQLIQIIEDSGCDMLRDMIDGDETKDELVKHLKQCNCPTLKNNFSGI